MKVRSHSVSKYGFNPLPRNHGSHLGGTRICPNDLGHFARPVRGTTSLTLRSPLESPPQHDVLHWASVLLCPAAEPERDPAWGGQERSVHLGPDLWHGQACLPLSDLHLAPLGPHQLGSSAQELWESIEPHRGLVQLVQPVTLNYFLTDSHLPPHQAGIAGSTHPTRTTLKPPYPCVGSQNGMAAP